MADQTNSDENTTAYKIPFEDENYRLSAEWLDKQVRRDKKAEDQWIWPSLRFHSFKKGKLTLINTCENRSYTLTLQVADHYLLVSCSCGHDKSYICAHAYSGLGRMLCSVGKYYFKSLLPDGAISLAFAHKKYFDKEESTAGLRVSLRPELKAVFRLAPKVKHLDIPALLELPDERPQHPPVQPKEALGYLVTVPIMNKFLPGLLPCQGKLTKDGNHIKSWDRFMAIADRKDHKLFTDSQIELNLAGDYLWEMVKKTAGCIIQEDTKKGELNKLTDIFDIWKEIFPVLKKQRFVYVYTLYGIGELNKRPVKNRMHRIVLSEQAPSLKFVLMDKGNIYQFQMEVWINGKRLSGYDARASFFIIHKEVMYMLWSLRDAALVEWLCRSGGWITVFKEHFDQFEKEVLIPLKKKYPVAVFSGKGKRH